MISPQIHKPRTLKKTTPTQIPFTNIIFEPLSLKISPSLPYKDYPPTKQHTSHIAKYTFKSISK